MVACLDCIDFCLFTTTLLQESQSRNLDCISDCRVVDHLKLLRLLLPAKTLPRIASVYCIYIKSQTSFYCRVVSCLGRLDFCCPPK